MIKYNSAFNGIGYINGNNGEILNAHFSYKGRSVIIDYEFCLHCYEHLEPKSNNERTSVPFEMYPYGDDIYVGYVDVDEIFHKADMSKLIAMIDEALKNEPEPYDYSNSWVEDEK